MNSLSAPLALLPHPAAPSTALTAVAVVLSRTSAGDVVLRYCLRGDLARLRVPLPALAARSDGLWRGTCCEAFFAATGATAYREFNFSPSGEWAAYAFSSERQRDAADPADDARPAIALRRGDGELELTATVPLRVLPAASAWQIGLSVVAEDSAGALSYWALRHPGVRPDFHHREAFALALDSRIPA